MVKEMRKKTAYKILGNIILVVVVFLLFILLNSEKWFLENFGGVAFSTAVYQLFSPLKGTEVGLVQSYIRECLIFSLVASVILCLLYNTIGPILKKALPEFAPIFHRKVLSRLMFIVKNVVLTAFLIGVLVQIYHKAVLIRIPEYIENLDKTTVIYDEEYRDPKEVDIVFPDHKRNLLLIYMESMETTYADTERGGGKPENYIPELTKLAEENLYFSNHEDFGGASGSGTGWTMAGLLAVSSGVNYKLPIEGNSADKYSTFLPGLTCMGDILEEAGYQNYFMCGSDAVFAGRKDFYTQHGNYHIFDYHSAIEDNVIDKDYKVLWGMEDEKLYKYAKQKLTEITAGGEPFNFTMLTVDTHHPDGYVCGLCEDKYSEQYANVISCASKQVSQFIEWASGQEWYENTTIVITGDHLSMKQDFWSDVQRERRVYNCFVNLPQGIAADSTVNREFCLLDMFPTIMASLGVDIEGDRLGLGTNLFSSEKTLPEKMGIGPFSEEIWLHSDYYFTNFIMNK